MSLAWYKWTILVLCCLCIVVFTSLTAAVYLTIVRRHCNVIRQRTTLLVVISAAGNLGDILVTTLTCVWLSDSTAEASWTGFYLGIVAEYVFFAPYLLRAEQIKVSFVDFLASSQTYQKHLHRLQPRWYLTLLFLGLMFLLIFPVFFALLTPWSPHTPFTFTYSAVDNHLYKRAVFGFIHFLQVISLIIMVYNLRSVEEPYSLNSEMKIVCGLLFIVSIIDVPQWSFHELSFFVLLFRDCGILIVSNLWPVLVFWDENTDVQPTPENIRCLEFAFQHAETLEAFRSFLRSKRQPDFEPSDSTSTAFSHEGEGFLWMLIELNKLEDRPRLKPAQRLFSTYIESGEPSFPSSVIEEVKEALKKCGEKDEEGIVEAFGPVRCYATTILSNQYYPKFTASEQFVQLQKRVEMLTKRWGQLTMAVPQ